MLSQELVKLYNTLALIETNGENTKLMAQCMVFVEQLASQARMSEMEKEKHLDEETDKKEEEK